MRKSLSRSLKLFALSLSAAGSARALPVLVIDEGVDLEHQGFNGQLNRFEIECTGSPKKDNNKDGFKGNCLGWNAISNDASYMPAKVKSYFTENKSSIQELLALFARAMAGDKEARRELKSTPERIVLGEKLLGFSHGTHVGGIIAKQSQATARLQSLNVFTGSDGDVIEKKQSLELTMASVSPSDVRLGGGLLGPIKGLIDFWRLLGGKSSIYDSSSLIDRILKSQRSEAQKRGELLSDYVRASGAKVANLSLGVAQVNIEKIAEEMWLSEVARLKLPAGTERNEKQQLNYERLVNGLMAIMKDSWDELFRANPDTLFVVAAGNDGDGEINDAGNNEVHAVVPANSSADFKNVITVAATDERGAIVDFSNFGAKYVNIGAPGYQIASYAPADLTVTMSGTSMAAPYVAGVAAHLRTVEPTLTADATRKLLESTAFATESLKGKVSSGGMVSLTAALASLGKAIAPIAPNGVLGGRNRGTDLGTALAGLDLLFDDTRAGEVVETPDFAKEVARSLGLR